MTNYDAFAETFSNSRKSMQWDEINYFMQIFSRYIKWKKNISILDIWCWNWRLLSSINEFFPNVNFKYIWVDNSIGMINEARKLHNESEFQHLDMKDIHSIEKQFDLIVMVASFHHLKHIDERESFLYSVRNILKLKWELFMTNWALLSDLNLNKYFSSRVLDSVNKFWSCDYSIKIWEHRRFYHAFNIEELTYLFHNAWFEVIENKLFKTQKNIISHLKVTSL